MTHQPLQSSAIFVRDDLTLLVQIGDVAEELQLDSAAALLLAHILIRRVVALNPPPANGPVDKASPEYCLCLAADLVKQVSALMPESRTLSLPSKNQEFCHEPTDSISKPLQ